MAVNKYENEKDLSFPDLPDLALGDPPPQVALDESIPPVQQPKEKVQPSVDTISSPSAKESMPIAPDTPKTPEIAPPPPPPPDYGMQKEAQPAAPESTPLQTERKTDSQEIQQPGVSASQTSQNQPAPQPAVQVQKSEARKEIEDLLSDGLTEIYKTMTPQQQEVFRQKGDEAATSIEQMVGTFRASARKVVDVIRGWLSTIPGVNKFFLEQESKLKTDEIMKLQMKLKKKERLKKLNVQ
jgi:type IV secretory pathway VirB10-like protein